MTQKLTQTQITQQLRALPQWQQHGSQITRQYTLPDFPAAIRFVNQIAQAAETAQHHPDIDIRWNKIRLTLTTHDAGGLTQKDIQLACQADQIHTNPTPNS